MGAFFHMRSPTKLVTRVGTSSFALESVPFSVATFFRWPTDYATAVCEAIRAGGDTDTTAAMVGAMVGANVGLSGIPQEWIDLVPATSRAIELADEMMETFYRE
jgi:ADP-ribosylglycohydrolase